VPVIVRVVDDNRVIDIGGLRLAYRVWGSPGAEPLVLLHALGESAADWGRVAPAFARDRRVYAPNLRGHGRPRQRSLPERPAGELPYDWEMVAAIRSQIDNPDPAWLGRLGRITAETLVIGGGAPSYIPQDWVIELARHIPGAQVKTIPAGHLIHDADPEAFTRTALEFLNPAQAATGTLG
jgi:pimeloyl-ACP methyl ester carboxylesterase